MIIRSGSYLACSHRVLSVQRRFEGFNGRGFNQAKAPQSIEKKTVELHDRFNCDMFRIPVVQELKICRYGLMDRVRAQETCGIVSMLARKQLRASGRVGQYFLDTS